MCRSHQGSFSTRDCVLPFSCAVDIRIAENTIGGVLGASFITVRQASRPKTATEAKGEASGQAEVKRQQSATDGSNQMREVGCQLTGWQGGRLTATCAG